MGVGRHYTGAEGRRYFNWQQDVGQNGVTLDVRKFISHVSLTDVLVDFGCGGGHLLETLDAAVKIGIEPNAAARESAAARGVRVVADTAAIDSATVDTVISNHALEHSLSPFDELRELRRILKPGGRLVMWLPVDDWRRQRHHDPHDVNRHLFTWTPLLMGNLLTEAGLEVGEIEVVNHAWPPGVHYLRRLPAAWFDPLAWMWSVLDRRRQLRVLAYKPEVIDASIDS